jgi:2,3-bisphosphoglycerate-dependent phosphoglycerate mutase
LAEGERGAAAVSASLLLIRHCRATGPLPDAPLSAEGHAAATSLAERLHALRVDAVYSSPFRRAHDSVAPFAERQALMITVDPRLAERRFAEPDQAAWLDQVRRSFLDLDYRPPGGETLREVQHRGRASLADIAGMGHRLPAVSTHGNLLAALLRRVDASFGFEAWRGLGNPDLFKLRLEDGRPVAFERLSV